MCIRDRIYSMIQESLIFDLYYRENCKSRPVWATDIGKFKHMTHAYCKNCLLYTSMAHAISHTIVSVTGSSITTIAGFVALCFMSFTLGLDLGIVMAKGVVRCV